MRARDLRQWAAVLVGALVVQCDVRPAPVVIGLTAEPAVAPLVERALAATRGRGDPEIRVRPRVEGALPRSVDVAQAFVTDPQLVGVVGPSGSGDALLAAPVYAAAGIPQILPTANAPETRSTGWRPTARWT